MWPQSSWSDAGVLPDAGASLTLKTIQHGWCDGGHTQPKIIVYIMLNMVFQIISTGAKRRDMWTNEPNFCPRKKLRVHHINKCFSRWVSKRVRRQRGRSSGIFNITYNASSAFYLTDRSISCPLILSLWIRLFQEDSKDGSEAIFFHARIRILPDIGEIED